MRSNTERRKVFSHPPTSAKGAIAALSAVVSLFAAVGNAQKADESPVFSVFRKDVGIVRSVGDAGATHATEFLNLEPVTGDFDADGVLDAGTFDRSSRLFVVRLSGDGSTLAVSAARGKGRSTVATADYDGDKRTDLATWQAGTWNVRLSSRQFAADVTVFGTIGDVPVPADYDGDGRADFAVFRPAENRWYIRSSETGHVRTIDFGVAGTDLLLPADYTGDGKADAAIYRNGVWRMLRSEDGAEEIFDFGFDDARPVPGDFDRDGETDFAVYRKGRWFVYEGDRLVSYSFGNEDDTPLGGVAVRSSTAGN